MHLLKYNLLSIFLNNNNIDKNYNFFFMNFLVKIISNSYKNIQNLIKLYIYDIYLIPTYYNN